MAALVRFRADRCVVIRCFRRKFRINQECIYSMRFSHIITLAFVALGLSTVPACAHGML